MRQKASTNEDIISNAVGAPPDVHLRNDSANWSFARWRSFVDSYQLGALRDPIFVLHVGGKPCVRTRDGTSWSAEKSVPGCATIVPAGQSTGWLVEGELDTVTLTLPGSADMALFSKMRFAFADQLSAAIIRQLLAEAYAPQHDERRRFIDSLVDTLVLHISRGAQFDTAAGFPTSGSSAYRLHKVLAHIRQAPAGAHRIEDLAALAGLAPSHFSRVFKEATGMTPHHFVTRVRMERAQELLDDEHFSIGHISEAVGFSNQSAFTRAFNDYTGKSPGAWRENRLN